MYLTYGFLEIVAFYNLYFYMKIVLASNSLRRIELLKKITNDFIVCPSDIDENISKSPFVLPVFLSLLKAENVLEKESGLIIAADTIVCLDDKVFGKPKNHNDAVNTLKSLSGNTHTVITGICIAYNSVRFLSLEKTFVTFNKLSIKQIEQYIETFKPFDKAGSYGIQDNFPLVSSVNGDYENVLGFPVNLIKKILTEIPYSF